jgi:hypothetical protein
LYCLLYFIYLHFNNLHSFVSEFVEILFEII